MARDPAVRLTADRPGELAGVVQALSLARAPGAARSALRTGGFTIEGEHEVLVLPMPDRPGELSMITRRLADDSVNVRFVYMATETRVVIGVDDITQARQVLDSSRN